MSGTTPTTNGLATTFVPDPGIPYIDALLAGIKWEGNVGTGATITYSIPGLSSNWASAGTAPGGYGNPVQYEPDTLSALSATEAEYFGLRYKSGPI
jgi:hypothetical protein